MPAANLMASPGIAGGGLSRIRTSRSGARQGRQGDLNYLRRLTAPAWKGATTEHIFCTVKETLPSGRTSWWDRGRLPLLRIPYKCPGLIRWHIAGPFPMPKQTLAVQDQTFVAPAELEAMCAAGTGTPRSRR